MKIETASPTTKPTQWPRLMRHRTTGTIYLVRSLVHSDFAIELENCVRTEISLLIGELEDLPVGYAVTLTNE
jgi:hypothetical protein